MVFRGLTDTLRKDMKNMETTITERKLAQGMCAAAAVGIIMGILITHKSRKKMRDDIKHKIANASVTIEVHDLERLLIQRLQ